MFVLAFQIRVFRMAFQRRKADKPILTVSSYERLIPPRFQPSRFHEEIDSFRRRRFSTAATFAGSNAGAGKHPL